MKVTPVLGFGYKSKDKTLPLYLKVNIGQKRKLIPVGVKILESQWDAKNKKVINRENASQINIKIIEMLGALEKNFISDGSVSSGNKADFYWWYDQYIQLGETKFSTYHVKKMKTVRAKLVEYSPTLTVKQMDVSFLQAFETWLKRKEYHVNYVADILIRVKTVMSTIVKSGQIEYHKNPFLHYKIKQKRTEKMRLPFADVLKLQKADLSGRKALARDMYIFSFYCGGIRFGDLSRLNKKNFLDGRLLYTMHKTDNQKNIKIHPVALEIITRHGFKFDLGINWKIEDKSINAKNTLFNKHLKAACKVAEIPEITFHTSRHSIADLAISKNTPDTQLQAIFGHKKSSTTQAYKRNFYQKESDEALDKLFDQ